MAKYGGSIKWSDGVHFIHFIGLFGDDVLGVVGEDFYFFAEVVVETHLYEGLVYGCFLLQAGYWLFWL